MRKVLVAGWALLLMVVGCGFSCSTPAPPTLELDSSETGSAEDSRQLDLVAIDLEVTPPEVDLTPMTCTVHDDCAQGCLCLEGKMGNRTCVCDCDRPFLDSDGDGAVDCLDDDDDGDGWLDDEDNCPLLANPGQENWDHDGEGDLCDIDDDNDGAADEIDCSPMDPLTSPLSQESCNGLDDNCNGLTDETSPDSDADGQADCIDDDDDDDGVPDLQDNCPLLASSVFADLDGDGQGDACDPDDDGDLIPDDLDNCPQLANGDQSDWDGDTLGDVCDPCPEVADLGFDGDGDGVGDLCDAFPSDPNEWSDYDSDGIGDHEDSEPFDWGKVGVSLLTQSSPGWQPEIGGPGDLWPNYRHDAHRWAMSGSSGNLAYPQPTARIPLDSDLSAKAVLVDNIAGSTTEELIVASGGRVVAFKVTGDPLWETPVLGGGVQRLNGLADLDGNGTWEIIATRTSPPPAMHILRGSSGTVASSVTDLAQADNFTGLSVTVLEDVTGDGLPELCTVAGDNNHPATVRIYSFENGAESPEVVAEWQAAGYMVPGPCFLADLEGDGERELMVMNPYGVLLAFPLDGIRPFQPTWTSPLSSMSGTLAALDLDEDGDDEIVSLKDAPGTNPDGAVVFEMEGGVLQRRWEAYTGNGAGTRLMAPWKSPLADTDLDGHPELVLSARDTAVSDHWQFEVRDALNGDIEFQLEDRLVLGLLEEEAGQPPLLVLSTPVDGEPTEGQRLMEGWRWSQNSLAYERIWDGLEAIPLFTSPLLFPVGATGGLDAPSANQAALASFTDGDDAWRGVFLRDTDFDDFPDTIILVELSTGTTLASQPLPEGTRFSVPWIYQEAGLTRIVLMSNAGEIQLFNQDLKPKNALYHPGGSQQTGPSLAPRVYFSGEVPLLSVPGLQGRTKEYSYAPSAEFALDSLELKDEGSFSGSIVHVFSVPQGNPNLLVAHTVDGQSVLSLGSTGSANLVWTQPFPEGLTLNHVSSVPSATGDGEDFVVQWRDSLDSSGHLVELRSAGTGEVLATMEGPWSYIGRDAVALDMNNDGSCEWLTLSHKFSVSVHDTVSGTRLWDSLEDGAISMGSPGWLLLFPGDGEVEPVLLATGGYKVTALSPVGDGRPFAWQVLWSVDAATSSAPALVDCDGTPPLDVTFWSSDEGLVCRRMQDGQKLWSYRYLAGGLLPESSPESGAVLSSPAVADLDGDQNQEILTGGGDGVLYAVTASTGELLWTIDFGAVVWEPIAADLDGTGMIEVLVVVGDGYLYVVDGYPLWE